MNRRQRLMNTLQGKPVDRPAVSFYEINGLDEDQANPDPFNIYTHPSWKPVIDLARHHTDRIVMRQIPLKDAPLSPLEELAQQQTWIDADGSLITRITLRWAKHTLTATTRRDPHVNTLWHIEHLLKDLNDLQAYVELPLPEFTGVPDVQNLLETEAILGDSGITMIDTPDPLCLAASLFDLSVYTMIASYEPAWFHRLLERFATQLHPKTEAVARAAPGRLWRIHGPEYASPPYLNPRLFKEFVVGYVTPMVQSIQRYGGFARIHCHGRLAQILDDIASTGCSGLDPIEPPPQGDIELREVRQKYGGQMVLFGNLEASDLEILPTPLFERKIRQALAEGTAGEGRGFVLMPSSCPYGRELSPLTRQNYEKMIEITEQWSPGDQQC